MRWLLNLIILLLLPVVVVAVVLVGVSDGARLRVHVLRRLSELVIVKLAISTFFSIESGCVLPLLQALIWLQIRISVLLIISWLVHLFLTQL